MQLKNWILLAYKSLDDNVSILFFKFENAVTKAYVLKISFKCDIFSLNKNVLFKFIPVDTFPYFNIIHISLLNLFSNTITCFIYYANVKYEDTVLIVACILYILLWCRLTYLFCKYYVFKYFQTLPNRLNFSL